MHGARTIGESWNTGRNNFNLMRLVAAWMVIYGHAGAVTGAPGADLITQLTKFRFAGGVAVDVFFVISGFLIAASLERNSVRDYLISRGLRIMPALLVCVLLSALVMGPLLTTSSDYWRHGEVWRYVALNGSLWTNAYSLPGVFETLPRTAINGSLWTLPIEAKLYLALLVAWLAGVLTPRRYPPLWALALTAAAALVWWKHPLPDHLANPANCAAFFITGTLFWVNRASIRLSMWPLLALFAMAAALRGTAWFYPAYFGLLAYGTLFVAMVPRLPGIRRIDLSYGLYLYGWPMQQLALMAGADTPLRNTMAATIAALICAALSWFLIEQPALRLKRRLLGTTPHHPASAVSGAASGGRQEPAQTTTGER
ncbi:MAG: acyltransferase [Lysobacteraceae bacterium]|nr:MAG: acyltransferase [Xanthomonadaceae bacterium]